MYRQAVAIARVLVVPKEKLVGVEDAHVKETTSSVRQNVGVVGARNLVKIG